MVCRKPLAWVVDMALEVLVLAPEGPPRIAQRFNAGEATRPNILFPAPEGRLRFGSAAPPGRADHVFGSVVPALKRWAILKRPFGAKNKASRTDSAP
jgi:hypothetical protein